MYDRIFKSIVESLKMVTNSKDKSDFSGEKFERLKKLRVPLCSFIEYKGVSALAIEELTGDIEQTRIIEREELLQWK